MSYGQVWYEDRHGRPYFLVSGMRVYQSTERQHTGSRNDHFASQASRNTIYNERTSRPASHHHSTASAAYAGYAASLPRVRFADEVNDQSWDTGQQRVSFHLRTAH